MTIHAFLFTLAAIGISETVYLIKKRKIAEQPVCIIGEKCKTVLNSKYNNFLGIHNDVLGLLFYIFMAIITALLVIETGPLYWLDVLARIAVVGASIASLILIYLQWRVIKAWCFWCVMSALTVGIMLIIVLAGSLIIK